MKVHNNGQAEFNYMCNFRLPESFESLLLRLCPNHIPGSFQRRLICTLNSFLSMLRHGVMLCSGY